jgi:hypothetical protein
LKKMVDLILNPLAFVLKSLGVEDEKAWNQFTTDQGICTIFICNLELTAKRNRKRTFGT